MRAWLRGLVFGALAALPGAAMAQTLPIPLLSGPQDVSQFQATINQQVLAKINAVLGAAMSMPPGAVNFISLNATPTGQLAAIQLGGTSADANAGIGISPNGSGNIVLFAPTLGEPQETGVLQFANNASFAPARGLATCPGVPAGQPVFNTADHVTGYWIIKDWLGRSHATPAC